MELPLRASGKRSPILAVGVALTLFACRLSAAAVPEEARFQISGPYVANNLTVFLIHGSDTLTGKSLITLQEALEQKKIVVHETGQVNELTVENLTQDEPVYIQFGDIVKGGRQDRIIANDLLVPPHSGKMAVVSFCVEQGRWSQRGKEIADRFSASTSQFAFRNIKLNGGGLAQFGTPSSGQLGGALGALGGLNQPANNLGGGGSAQLGGAFGMQGGGMNSFGQSGGQFGMQGGVWHEVDRVQTRLKEKVGNKVQAQESRTSLVLTLENKIVASKAAGTVEKVSAILHGQDDVVGYAYAINGRLQGAEVYGSGKLFRKLWPKLLHANAVEAVAELSSEKSQHTVGCTAVLDCLEDAEKGKALERDVTARIKLLWRETEGNILFETRDREQPGKWLHRTYVAKKQPAPRIERSVPRNSGALPNHQ